VPECALLSWFFAAEEERTLGSWAYAKSLLDEITPENESQAPTRLIAVNLESIGTNHDPAYIREDGFATRRFHSSQAMIDFVNDGALRQAAGSARASIRGPDRRQQFSGTRY